MELLPGTFPHKPMVGLMGGGRFVLLCVGFVCYHFYMMYVWLFIFIYYLAHLAQLNDNSNYHQQQQWQWQQWQQQTTSNKQQFTSGHCATVNCKQRGWMMATSSHQYTVKAAASIALQQFGPQPQQLSTSRRWQELQLSAVWEVSPASVTVQ